LLFNRKTANNVSATLFSICLIFHICIIAFSVLSGRPGSSVYAAGVNVSGATVVAYGVNGSGMATTDLNGHYNINQGLKSGNYTLKVIKEGYLSSEVPAPTRSPHQRLAT
jgi:hypothetical protein